MDNHWDKDKYFTGIEFTGDRRRMSYLESTDILTKSLKKSLHERKVKWWGWHKKNPLVYELFEKYTFDAIESGRKHYSHWAIINRIRWDREIETQGSDFKISNDYIGFYARLFHAQHPEHDGFFRLKQLKEEALMESL